MPDRLLEPALSSYGRRSLQPSPVNRMMSAFAADFREGTDVNLGVGYVNEETIPRTEIQRAFEVVLGARERHRSALNYGASQGSENLIRAIKRFLARRRQPGLDARLLETLKVVIGPSGVTSLLEGAASVLAPGIVVTSDPLYYIFCDYLVRAGFEVLPIPEDAQGIRVDLIGERIGGRLDEISFFYVLGVNNPTSTVLSNDRRRALVELVTAASERAGRKLPLLFDGAYEMLLHDPDLPAPVSLLPLDRLGLVYELGTLSKLFAPALRVGYALGRASPFLDCLVQRTNDVGFSAPLANQEIASVLLDEVADAQIERVNRGYREKARRVLRALRESLGAELEEVVGGQAGFYLYLTLRTVETCEGSAFHSYCSRTTGDPRHDGDASARRPRLVYIPGEHCVHPRGELAARARRQLRLSYGYESLEHILAGIRVMSDAIAYARDEPP